MGPAAKSQAKRLSGSAQGAPAQRSQSSRKGKRAWRKHIDLDVVDNALEEAREEERVVGSRLHDRPNAELFTIDTSGDATVRKSMPRPRANLSSLTSTRILSQRSAVPAVQSRLSSTTSSKRRSGVSAADKDRLLRIGKRPRHGPLNSFVDETELGKGSALFELSAAAKQAGYNVWDAPEEDTSIPESVRKVDPKAPTHANPRDIITVPAITTPHQGSSYNPIAQAHTELLGAAADAEARRLEQSTRLAEIKAKFASAGSEAVQTPGVPIGMAVGTGDIEGDGEEEEVEGWAGVRAPRTVPRPKTKSQRAKALKQLQQKRALAEQIHRKRMLAAVHGAKALRSALEKDKVSRTRILEAREAKIKEQLAAGLGGSRLGRHRVATAEIDVQLGEDLSESLRALKPEGNLFRDRFLSMQHRGLVEPRALLVGRRKQAKTKEYEKHAWKHFA